MSTNHTRPPEEETLQKRFPQIFPEHKRKHSSLTTSGGKNLITLSLRHESKICSHHRGCSYQLSVLFDEKAPRLESTPVQCHSTKQLQIMCCHLRRAHVAFCAQRIRGLPESQVRIYLFLLPESHMKDPIPPVWSCEETIEVQHLQPLHWESDKAFSSPRAD